MRANPYLNAAAASAYICGIGLLFRHIASVNQNTPDNLVDPIAFLSVFVFSAAVMGFLFFYRPAVLLMENKRPEAVSFFLKTLATFGVFTILFVAILSRL